ncbi:DUF4316 domain-containing protein [Faecalispora anaeroviscerum]|uniref:DUF4316 domain-containing protein n=1 Tax=Faecalispora anaeroviscerum TaxID=2991836 RepID=UPI0024B8EBD5|nr:DUF4316 domain-containing protein [Faecalispora anaeroviscerum]
MNDKDNYLKNAELSTEQNYDMIDSIPNNIAMPLSLSVPVPQEKPLDRVKEPPRRRRNRELER